MTTRRVAAAIVCFAGAIGVLSAAHGATTEYSTQKLDRIDIASTSVAANVGRDTDLAAQPWETSTYVGVLGSNLNACQNTAAGGMYCLEGGSVKKWESPAKIVAGDGVELFSCANTQLGLDRGGLCTALAVDVAGNIWIAGKRNNAFSLFKVTKRTCPSNVSGAPPYRQITPAFCAQEFASGRPILIDLTVIEGDAADGFPLNTAAAPFATGGVLAVEAKKEVTYFKDVAGAPPVSIAAGKAWGLAGSEQLQSATLLQELLPVDSINWILVTTSTGRVLAKRVRWDSTSTTVYWYTSAQNVALVSPALCTGAPTEALYRIRASSKSGDVYVSDRRGCRLIALDPQIQADPLTFGPQDVIAQPNATAPDAVLTIAPESLSISPGIDVDLYADCGPGKTCILIGNTADTDYPGASLSDVNVMPSSPTGMTVFQIKDFPDCRYIAYSEQPVECKGTNSAILKADGNPLAPPPSADYENDYPKLPERLYLNIRPLLPREVTDVFTQSDKYGSLPNQMLLSPRYRGLASRNTFDGLFGVTNKGIRFRDTFTAEFDVSDLIGVGIKLGCGGQPFNSTSGPALDVVVTLSERYTTVGGLNGGVTPQFTDMLINKGCENPTSGSGTRWSLYAYGLQLAKDLVTTTSGTVVEYPDTIFARLVLSLSQDLTDTMARYLCVNADPGGNVAPVGQPMCSNLQASWANTASKLQNCVLASTDPKQSSQKQNCQAFESQYLGYKSDLDAIVLSGDDPANRLGEVRARTEVLRYVYDTQYVPSIPATGFTDGITAP